MQARTADEIQHLVNLSGTAIVMVRDPDFAAEFANASETERQNYHTCLKILADTTVILFDLQHLRPRYRVRARTRPHGIDPTRLPQPCDHPDLFPDG